MMLPSLTNLKRIYETGAKKVPTKRETAKPKRISFHTSTTPVYQIAGQKQFCYTRYFAGDLKHFGVFGGDVLTIDRQTKWSDVEEHTLYAVVLPNNKAHICAIKQESSGRVALHDGRGGNFRTYQQIDITLIGLVVRIEKGSIG